MWQNSKTWNMTKLNNSKCGKTQKLKMWEKKTQQLKMWQNSKIKNVSKTKNINETKLLNSKCDKKIKNLKCDKSQKLKILQNSTTQI